MKIMEIDPQLVKQLREKTNAGFMDCKRALVESGGDLGKAEGILRTKGIASAGDSFGPQNPFRFAQITAAFHKSAFAIHKACIGFFAELLYQLWIDFHDFHSVKTLHGYKSYIGLLCKRCNFCNAYLPSGGDAGHFDLLANARFVACRNDSVHELLQNHADSANRIIVASDWVIDDVGVRVGIYDGDYWNSKPSRFINSVLFADCVDHHKGIW